MIKTEFYKQLKLSHTNKKKKPACFNSMQSSTVALQQKTYTYILLYLEQNQFFKNFLLFPPEINIVILGTQQIL